jgi:hypothetical protein
MTKHVEEYLSDLRARLSKRLSKVRAEELVSEVQGHLILAVRDLTASGSSEEDAERTAVLQMGSSKVLAHDLILQETGITTKPSWRVALVPLIILVGALTLEVCWPILGRLYAEHVFLVETVMMKAALLAFIIAVIRSRRWLLAPYLAVFVLCALAMGTMRTVFWSGAFPDVKMFALLKSKDTQVSEAKAEVTRINGEAQYSTAALQAVREGKRLPAYYGFVQRPNINKVGVGEFVWGSVVDLPGRLSDSPNIERASDVIDTRTAWLSDGPKLITLYKVDLAKSSARIAALQAQTAFGCFTETVGRSIVGTSLHLLVLAILNGLLLLLITGSRRWATRRFTRRILAK